MIVQDRPPAPWLSRSIRPLRWIPLLWLVLLVLDSVVVGLVAVFGEPMAFPGQDLRDSPNDIPMVPISWGPVIYVVLGAATVTIADGLVARRLPASRGPAFLALGLITTPYLLVLVAATWFNPLRVIIFDGGDAGEAVIAPGPLGYQYVRTALLVLIMVARVAAVVLVGRGTSEVRARTAPIPARPRPALLAMAALITLSAAGLAILVINLVAFADVMAQAEALRPEPYALRRLLDRELPRLLGPGVLLVAGSVVSSVLARLSHRGGRSTAGAFATGMIATAWPAILMCCLELDPAGWNGPLRISGQRLAATWYPMIMVPLLIIAVGGLLLLWFSLNRPGTVRWLISGRPEVSRSA